MQNREYNYMHKIFSELTAEPRGKLATNKKFKIGFLVFCLALVASQIILTCFYPQKAGNNSGLIVSMMPLLTHLAFSFNFPPRIMAALRVIAIVFVAGGLISISG